jgi:phospholipid/cholesterol/gamma-HCH transport system permease protein
VGPVQQWLAWLGDLANLSSQTLVAPFRSRIPGAEVVRQMAVIGVQSLPITILTVAFAGMVLALHTANTLKRLGVESLVGGIVAVTMAREAAPVLTAVIVAARVGSAIAAELGTMAVTEQVDAMRSLGVSPVSYLVVPRFLAAVLMLPILTVFGNLAGVTGGYVVALSAGVPGPLFLDSARDLVHAPDLFKGMVKTLVFGAIIALVGCHQGLRTTGGAAGVGRSTTVSVVAATALVYVVNYLMAEWLFGSDPITYR